MKKRPYADNAFDELVKTLKAHTGNGNSVDVLIKMICENDEEFNGLKDRFIHDMNKFLTNWFTLESEANRVSSKLRAKLLSKQFVETYFSNDFNSFTTFCYDKIDQKVNPYTNHLMSRDLINYTLCVVKAIIQYTRCEWGYDNNSTKYPKVKKS